MVGMVEKEWENIELKIPMITIYGGNGREGMLRMIILTSS